MTTFSAKPDPKYYMNILEHDDGSYTADQKPLDDWTVEKLDMGQPGYITVVMFGLRSTLCNEVINAQAERYIYKYAPPWAQANATQVIVKLGPQSGSLPADQQQDLDDANALWDFVNACVAYSNQLSDEVRAMTFEQILVYVVPTTGWPNPPASLVPVPAGMDKSSVQGRLVLTRHRNW